jgi:hypothetical protein
VRERKHPGPGHDCHNGPLATGEEDRTSLHRGIDRCDFVVAQSKDFANAGESCLFDSQDDLRRCSRNQRSAKVRADEILDLLRTHPDAGVVFTSLPNKLAEDLASVRVDRDPMCLIHDDNQASMVAAESSEHSRQNHGKRRRQIRRVRQCEVSQAY